MRSLYIYLQSFAHRWRLYALFWGLVLQREMSFRANFLSMLVANISVLFTTLVSTLFFFLKVNNLAGWTFPEMIAFLGTFQIIDGIWMTFAFFNVMSLQQMIRNGSLDSVLLKPVDSQWWVSFWKPNVGGIVDILIGMCLVCYGWSHTSTFGSAYRLCAYVVEVMASVVIWYSLNFIITCLAFWFTQIGDLFDLTSGLYDVAQRPDNLYAVWVRKFLLFLIPLGVSVSVPSRVLVSHFQIIDSFWMIFIAGIHLVICRVVWLYGLRNYSSTGSTL